LAEIILFDSGATRGNVAAFRSSPLPSSGSTMGRISSYLEAISQRLSHAIRPDRPGTFDPPGTAASLLD